MHGDGYRGHSGAYRRCRSDGSHNGTGDGYGSPVSGPGLQRHPRERQSPAPPGTCVDAVCAMGCERMMTMRARHLSETIGDILLRISVNNQSIFHQWVGISYKCRKYEMVHTPRPCPTIIHVPHIIIIIIPIPWAFPSPSLSSPSSCSIAH